MDTQKSGSQEAVGKDAAEQTDLRTETVRASLATTTAKLDMGSDTAPGLGKT